MTKKTFVLCFLFASLALPAVLRAQTIDRATDGAIKAVPSPSANKIPESDVKINEVSPAGLPAASTQPSAKSPGQPSAVSPQKVSAEVIKCGVNTFRVENDCGIGVFKNVYFQCHDGYEEKQGDYSSCKPSETWQKYAKEACQNRCSAGVKPTTSTAPVPSVQVTPSIKKEIPAAAPAIINAAPQSAVSSCYSDEKVMQEYNTLLVDLKNAEAQIDQQKQELIKNKIVSLKQEIAKSREKCAAISITTVGGGGGAAPRATIKAEPVNQCSQLEQWQTKINYYEKLAALGEDSLRKEASFSSEEVKKILSELREKYGEIKNKCSVKEGQAIRKIPATTASQVTITEPVNPVSAISGEEIDVYYKAKIKIITASKDAESQIRNLKALKDEVDVLVGNLIKSRKEFEATEVSGLVKEIKINPGEIKADNVTIATKEKKIFIEVGNNKPVSVETNANQVTMKDKNISVEVKNEISIKDNKLTVGAAEVKLAPSEIAEKLKVIPKTVVLREENAKAIYEIKTGVGRKLFGFIPISISKTITADAEDGSVLEEKLPWYSFITTK